MTMRPYKPSRISARALAVVLTVALTSLVLGTWIYAVFG